MARDRFSDDEARRLRSARRMAEKAFLSAARAAGRTGIRAARSDAIPSPALFSDLVELGLPSLAGQPRIQFRARVLLPDATGILATAGILAAEGRRQAEAALESAARAYGLAEIEAAARACRPALGAFCAEVRSDVAAGGPGFAPAFLPILSRRLARAMTDPLGPAELAAALPEALARARAEAIEDLEELRRLEAVTAMAGFARYADLFPEARALHRRLVLIVGPTNSGKTHAALGMAAAAADAVVLSPLRLLAMEHYERLAAMGLAAGMVTGEESIDADGATHVARTIEAADLSAPVELAVIDEIQMLSDPHRGWAWTQALLGMPARTVVMTGSPDAIPLVAAAAAMTGETLEVVVRERCLPLRAEPRTVGLRAVGAGDAVIAFSRRAAMALREELQAEGLEVAMVYGNLAPEVRRSEAARFRSGQADVLVATDAVGMGLNLPIRRVLFSALSKYDGRTHRDLTNAEIRQIGGRAGRFGGPAPEGVCAVMTGADPRRLAAALAEEPAAARDRRLYVRPSLSAVIAVAGREPVLLAPLLAHLRDNLVAGHGDLRMADIDGMIEAAALVDRHRLPLAVRYAYASCPLASAEADDLRVIDGWAGAQAAGEAVACPEPLAGNLAEAEVSGRRIMGYMWLARRFPDTFPDGALAAERRAESDEAVEAFLGENPWRRGRRMA